MFEILFRRILCAPSVVQSSTTHGLFPHTGVRAVHTYRGPFLGVFLDSS